VQIPKIAPKRLQLLIKCSSYLLWIYQRCRSIFEIGDEYRWRDRSRKWF